MKKIIRLYMLITLSLVSCNSVSVSTLTLMPIPSNTPLPTETQTPTAIPTKAPRPTATPLPELTATDVGLSWDPTTTTPTLIPCNLDEVVRNGIIYNHRGDGIIYANYPDKTHYVLAPLSGTIEAANLVNETVGWEINIATDYLKDGKRVYIDLVHTSTSRHKQFTS
jgi:hypothetical protein